MNPPQEVGGGVNGSGSEGEEGEEEGGGGGEGGNRTEEEKVGPHMIVRQLPGHGIGAI